MERLSYEQELLLGDRCVARRRITDLIAEEDRQPTAAEKKIIDIGDKAATELVRCYLPFIQGCASRIMERSGGSAGSIVEPGDLVGIGVTNALLRTRSFNPRGSLKPGGHSGVRFANYIKLDIIKAMRKELITNSSVLSVDPIKVMNTSRWNIATKEFFEEFGKHPTDEQIEEITGISKNQILRGNFQRSAATQVEEWTIESDSAEVRMVEASDKISLSEDNIKSSLIMIEVLAEYFTPDDLQFIIEAYGLIDGIPKDPGQLNEYYPDRFKSSMSSRRWFKNIAARMTHPQYRARIALKIAEVKARENSHLMSDA